ncbi:MAG: ABC transporter substrate-binding protein [Burkholderiales bacterium]
MVRVIANVGRLAAGEDAPEEAEVIDRGRALIVGVALGIFLLPVITGAQQARTLPRIGVVVAGSAPNPYTDALRRGLAEHGWAEGRNILIEYRYAQGRNERYPAIFAELVRLKVDVIVAGGGTAGARAAKQATSTIPIVTPLVGDPVASGLVSSLARPGGNVTGQSQVDTQIIAKRLELLKAILPKAERVAMLRDSTVESRSVQIVVDASEAAARSLGLRLQVLSVSRADEFDSAFAAAKASGAEGLVVPASAFFNYNRRLLIDLAERHRLPAVFENREFPETGGLMSYGVNVVEMYRNVAKYVDKILKGAKPTDLPVEQPTAFELVINLRTAKALQLSIPQTVLVRADRIIE